MKTLIISGGNIDIIWAEKFLSNNIFEYVIAADSGLKYAIELGVRPDIVLGDYDSLDENVLKEYRKCNEVIAFPKEKDYTDTHLAILSAIEHKADSITILGATGSRLDHTFTNICNMKAALDAGVECYIVDKNNRIRVADEALGKIVIDKKTQYGEYVSLIPLSCEVNITIKGFKYNLNNYDLKQGLSITQSNEIKENAGEILINKGFLAVFESLD